MADTRQVERLTRIALDDALESLGWPGQGATGRLLGMLLTPRARRFARQLAGYDQAVGALGLEAGAAWALRRWVKRLDVAGATNVPAEGPLLVVANHPGLTDGLALFAGLRRAGPDLRVVAARQPMLEALTHTSQYLIYLPLDGDGAGRMAPLRAMVEQLRNGGCLLTFPAGQIEADPALAPGALDGLAWSSSVGLLARLAPPDTRVVPAAVSGVLSPAAQRSPITRVRRTRVHRERVGVMLQVLSRQWQQVTVQVRFGGPLRAGTLVEECGTDEAIRDRVVQAMVDLSATKCDERT